MAIAVNCLVNEASRKFACASIFVFLRRSVTPQPCSKSVLPFCRTSTARPGASGEVTPEKTASIFFSIQLSDRCVCARVYFGVDRTRRKNTEPMSFPITDPPRSGPKDNTRLCKTLAEFVLEGRACVLKRAIYAPESAFRVLFLADSYSSPDEQKRPRRRRSMGVPSTPHLPLDAYPSVVLDLGDEPR